MAKIKLDAFQCERCRHRWVPFDIASPPRVCPKCKSPYWEKPRKSAARKPDASRRVLKGRGRGNARAKGR